MYEVLRSKTAFSHKRPSRDVCVLGPGCGAVAPRLPRRRKVLGSIPVPEKRSRTCVRCTLRPRPGLGRHLPYWTPQVSAPRLFPRTSGLSSPPLAPRAPARKDGRPGPCGSPCGLSPPSLSPQPPPPGASASTAPAAGRSAASPGRAADRARTAAPHTGAGGPAPGSGASAR